MQFKVITTVLLFFVAQAMAIPASPQDKTGSTPTNPQDKTAANPANPQDKTVASPVPANPQPVYCNHTTECPTNTKCCGPPDSGHPTFAGVCKALDSCPTPL